MKSRLPEVTVENAAARQIARWKADPVLFVKEALGADPDTKRDGFEQDDWQAEFLRLAAASERVAVASGTGVGKSTAIAWLVLWWHATHFPAKTLVTGSKFEQLRNTMWSELGAWIKRAPEQLQAEFSYTTERLELKSAKELSFAAVQTSAKQNAQNLAGWHSKHLLIVVDEASQVLEEIYETLEGNMSTTGSKMVLTGNPTQAVGYFADAFERRRQFWSTMRINGENVSRVSRSWISELAESFGRESNVYRVRILGQKPKQDDDGVIPLDLIESAIGRDVEPIDVQPIWGLDVARFGDDRTALAKRQGNSLMEKIKTWSGQDTEEVAGLVKREWLDTLPDQRPSRICIDVIGLGAGMFDKLKRDNQMRRDGTVIVGVNVAESPALGTKYERLRDELWFKGREWFQSRDCRMPDDDELVGELAAPKYKIADRSGKLKVEGKQELKARGLRSPDKADAFLLTLAVPEHAGKVAGFGAYGRALQAQTEFNVWQA